MGLVLSSIKLLLAGFSCLQTLFGFSCAHLSLPLQSKQLFDWGLCEDDCLPPLPPTSFQLSWGAFGKGSKSSGEKEL